MKLYIHDSVSDHTLLVLEWLERLRIKDSEPVTGIRYKKTGYKKGSEKPEADEGWQSIDPSARLYGKDEHFWFYFKFTFPKRFAGKNVYLKLFTQNDWADVSDQYIVFVNDEQIKTFDFNHTEIKLDSGISEYEVYVYSYSGLNVVDYFTGEKGGFTVSPCFKIVEIDGDIDKLFYDLKVLEDILLFTDTGTKEYADISRAIKGAKNLLDMRVIGSENFIESVKNASGYLENGIFAEASSRSPVVCCLGHTHIDIAWYWQVKQTREKAQRSFATVIDLMKHYPEYVFFSSQPVLYQMVKEEAPSLYEEIKQRVKEGRWEAEGGMWLEADCNLPSGESLVRQIIKGKRFFKEEFGVESEILWLPDVFGYPATLPQIMKKSGIKYFVTSKLGFNDTNRMPYDIFNWKGADGTEIFTYFITCQAKKKGEPPKRMTCYGAMGEASFVAGTWERMQQKDLSDEALLLYGFADGGGGARKEDIEQLKRLRSGLPNCPTVKFDLAKNFLARVKAKAESMGSLPVWSGELYLEAHRGTYTSQAQVKRNNRKGEFALSACEWLGVLSDVLTGREYPKQQIDYAWDKVLLNQFHDILPGSAAEEVYTDTAKDYEEVFSVTRKIITDSVNALAENIGTQREVVVFNPHSVNVSGEICVGGKYYYMENVPAKGYKAYDLSAPDIDINYGGTRFENNFYILSFDENYELSSIFDKRRNRELIAEGKRGNRLRTYEDMPVKFDAWDITRDYGEKYWDILSFDTAEFVDEGERKGVCITRKYLSCAIKQTIWLYGHTPRIDFQTVIDWDIPHVLLKVLFPLNINASKAICDIQFGFSERATHKNTSWDAAKFEFSAHKYVDMCEENFGVALMNDCKYGYGADGNELSLTLIKCATFPDFRADRGRHVFTYSIFSHGGYADREDVILESYLLNYPLFYAGVGGGKGNLPEEYSLISCDKNNVVLETVKQAENGKDTAVRLYECLNIQTEATISAGFDFSSVLLTDLLEEEVRELPFENRSVKITFKPFEIITLIFRK